MISIASAICISGMTGFPGRLTGPGPSNFASLHTSMGEQDGQETPPRLAGARVLRLPLQRSLRRYLTAQGGGAIRGIGEKFAANPVTGTSSLSVPIATSPGRSGFGPQLVVI